MNTALRALGWLMVLSGLALAGTRDPDTPDEKYVEFGKQFPFVLLIRSTSEPPDEKYPYRYGSAVAIRPHWVLTAAHVLANSKDPLVVVRPDKRCALGPVFKHQEFVEDTLGFNDIALCYSSDDLGLKFYPPLYTEHDEVGKAVTIAGFGAYGTFVAGIKNAAGDINVDGQRRAGHNKIDDAQHAVLLCTPSRVNRLPLEFMIASGDSGGGLFIGNKLAGINSFLNHRDGTADGTYGDESAFTRVSLYADWVESQIQKHELTILGRVTTGADVLPPASK